jgi:CheY-like chemotaxis protein
MNVLLVTADLVCSSRVAAAARDKAALQTASTLDALRARAGGCRLVLVDLQTPGLDIAQAATLVRQAAGPQATIVAFGPHVHQEKLAAARAAGCDAVLTQGQFYSSLDELLRSGSS